MAPPAAQHRLPWLGFESGALGRSDRPDSLKDELPDGTSTASRVKR